MNEWKKSTNIGKWRLTWKLVECWNVCPRKTENLLISGEWCPNVQNESNGHNEQNKIFSFSVD